MAIAAVTGALGVGAGLLKTFGADKRLKEAQQEAEQLKDPFYKIQDEFYKNQNIAAEQAQGGLTQAAKDYFTSETERGFGAGIQGILAAGGSANDIATLNDSFNRSIFNATAADSQAQMENIKYFMKSNSDIADQKTIQFLLNEKQPYENKLADITNRVGAERQNIYGGISDIVGSIAGFGTAMQNKELYGNGTPQTSQLRRDPFEAQITPIKGKLDTSFLNERSLPNAINNIFKNTDQQAGTTDNLEEVLNGLDPADREKLINGLLNQGL